MLVLLFGALESCVNGDKFLTIFNIEVIAFGSNGDEFVEELLSKFVVLLSSLTKLFCGSSKGACTHRASPQQAKLPRIHCN